MKKNILSIALILVVFILSGWSCQEESLKESVDTQKPKDIKEVVDKKQPIDKEESAEWNVYRNTKYNFSLKYPLDWFIKGTSISSIIQISNKKETEGLGGAPLGVRIEIMVLENLEDLSLEKWIEWMQSEGPEVEIISKKEIDLGGQPAIKEIQKDWPGPIETGDPISVYTALDNNIIQINYLGRQPDYRDNLKNFETILDSFEF